MTRGSILRASVALGLGAAVVLEPRRTVSEPEPFPAVPISIQEINPSAVAGSSMAGGRIHHLASTYNGTTYYAASEWGGLYRSTDSGNTWTRLDAYTPQATWDIAVDPFDKLYATSLYDGRVKSLAGISTSDDGGKSWSAPTAIPPDGFCDPALHDQLSAFGISIDDAVWVGTNCGVAKSKDGGKTWTFYDPTPNDPPEEILAVIVHNGIVDVVGSHGHARSENEGMTWTSATGFPLPSMAAGSIAVSPDEDEVLFVMAGSLIYESWDGGANWKGPIDPPGRNQGRIPFVKVNDRDGKNYDLWTGDVQLRRTACKTLHTKTLPRCTFKWSGPLEAGAHVDVGDLLFANTGDDPCPRLFANDGGVHVNTATSSPACQTPKWKNPSQYPHALWVRSAAVGHDPDTSKVTLLMGTQDNGAFFTSDPGSFKPAWIARAGGDVFDIVANAKRVVFAACCGDTGSTSLHVGSPSMTDLHTIAPLPGPINGFVHGSIVAEYGPDQYVVVWPQGASVTSDIEANPVSWTELGKASYPKSGWVSIRVSHSLGPHFFVQSGLIDGSRTFTADAIWRYDGTAPGNTWQPVPPPGPGGFSVFDVHPSKPSTIIASYLPPTGDPQMVMTIDSGTKWTPMPQLDALMTGNGVFRYRNQFGPILDHQLTGYPQPTLVAFDPTDPQIVVAGASDAGLFLSRDGGYQWMQVKHPSGTIGGTPHITRPQAAAFEHSSQSLVSETVDIYVGTMGRGVFRVRTKVPNDKLYDVCVVRPELCFPIPKQPPLAFLLWPIGAQSVFVSPLMDYCPPGGMCDACARGNCAAFYNLFLDGFDAASWDVGVLDSRGVPVPHGLFRTTNGAVISLQGVDGLFSRYTLMFAQRSGARPAESRFRSRLETADGPYVPRSPGDVIF